MEKNQNTANSKVIIGYIFRASMCINGTRIYAKDYGLKAFKIPIYK